MGRQTVITDAIRQLEAIGSEEVGRHIGVAINRTVLRARDQMRQAVRDTLGRTVTGPDSLYASRSVHDYTVNASAASQPDFRDGDASASVYVNARQGVRGQDQSATMKYLFGTGPNTRAPGDVGMSDNQINIPYPASINVIARIASFGNVPHELIVTYPDTCGRVGLLA